MGLYSVTKETLLQMNEVRPWKKVQKDHNKSQESTVRPMLCSDTRVSPQACVEIQTPWEAGIGRHPGPLVGAEVQTVGHSRTGLVLQKGGCRETPNPPPGQNEGA